MDHTGKLVSDFQTRFNELLDERPESSTDLAIKMKVSKQSISNWRHGVRSPNRITTIAIADFFGVKIEWLYGYDVEKYIASEPKEEKYNPLTTEARSLAKGVDTMPDAQRKAIFKLLSDLYPGIFNEGENSK